MKKNENLKQSSNPAEGRYSYDVVALEAECDGLRHLLSVSEARLAKQTKKLKKAKKAARDTQEAFRGVSDQHDEAMAQLQEARQLLEEWANTDIDWISLDMYDRTHAFLGLGNVETCHPPKPPERPLPSPNVFG